MRLLAAAFTLTVALLVGAATSRAAEIGANDDTAKYEADGGAAFYRQMEALGLRRTILTARFKPSEPLRIQDEPLLDHAITSALAAGIRVALAVYPYPPSDVESGLATPALFGAYAATLAEIFPQVTEFVVGNEPNQPAFWRPQFDARGANVSAASFGPYLAAAYDSLKAVDPRITVAGVGLSPHGNDQPNAKDNVSTSPVRFLRALGQWYRESGRTRPLMDAFSFHPYPRRATDSLDKGYSWPNAGFTNLDRVKQALWDAFHGTAQPTTMIGLDLHLDEVGWQVDTSGLPGYTGIENVPVTDEQTQATIYGALVRRAACDPDIAEVNFFGFRDDGARTGFQAALERLDGSLRPSAQAVRTAIAQGAARGCEAAEVRWRPGTHVMGAQMRVQASAPSSVGVRVSAGEDAEAVICVSRSGGPPSVHLWRRMWVGGGLCRTGAVSALRPLAMSLPVAPRAHGRARVAVELIAKANRKRRTVIVREASLQS